MAEQHTDNWNAWRGGGTGTPDNLTRDPGARQDAGRRQAAAGQKICLDVRGVSLFYGEKQALNDISLSIPQNRVTAFIGPSGCGKSTLLRCFNRLNDLIDDVVVTGEISLNGQDIHDRSIDVAQLRRLVGMVFQRPNPFPKSIYDNVAYGLRLQRGMARSEIDDRVEWGLRSAALWEEVSDRLKEVGPGAVGWTTAEAGHCPGHRRRAGGVAAR